MNIVVISPESPSYKMSVKPNRSWFSKKRGEVVWQCVLIFDLPVKVSIYGSVCVIASMHFNVHVRGKRCCFEPDVCQRKEVSITQHTSSLLLSLAALTKHQQNKPPADTRVSSAKEETNTSLHFYPSKNCPSVPNTLKETHFDCLVGINSSADHLHHSHTM